jgi:PAS domain S-box-containing protein
MKRRKSGHEALENRCRALRRRLEESERRLRQTQEIARIGSFERNLETGEGHWSDEHYRLLGYEPGQIEHSFAFFLEHVHPEDRERVRDILTGAYERMESFSYDCRFVRRDGEKRWFHHTGHGAKDGDGGRWIRGIFQDITERKRIEDEARESAGRYRVIFENSPLGIVHFDETGRILDCNAAFVRLLGSSREKLIGFPAMEKTPPPVRRVLARALGGKTAVFEDVYRSITGNRTLELRAVLNPVNPGRNPTEVIATYEDVSERKAGERERRKSEEKFRILAEAAPIGIWIYREGRIVYANPAFLAMTGYAAAEISAVSLMDLIHPDFRGTVRDKLAARREGDEGLFRYELKGLHRDGRAFWLDHSSVKIELDGAPSVLGISIDVTERERVARELRESRAMLARTEQMARIGSWEWDLAEDRITWSRELYRILGRSPDRGPLSFDELDGNFSPSHIRRLKEAARRTLRLGQPFSLELDLLSRRGGIRHCLARGEATPGNGRRPEKLTGSLQDITGRKRTERKLRDAREAAEAASHAKSEFIANMSHELRTPLNAILGYCQILVREESASETQRDGVSVIEKSGHHLLTLINDILDMSRVEVGKVRLESRPLDLRNLVNGVVDMLRFRAMEKGISLSAEMDPAVPRRVRSDAKRLRQILLNLVSNAVKFTERGDVRVEVFPADGAVGFSVADTGPGIPEDQRDAVFDAFRQLGTPEERSGGTGLGLTISRTLVMLMGGELTLESRAGAGSKFHFAVPLPAAEAWRNEGAQSSSKEETPIADVGAAPPPASGGRTAPPKTDALVPPGAEDLAELTELARIGNITRITAHARELARSDPSTAPFCLRLLELADEYDFEKILALLKSAGQKPGTPSPEAAKGR